MMTAVSMNKIVKPQFMGRQYRRFPNMFSKSIELQLDVIKN